MDFDFMILKRMKQGDETAFDSFVHKYYEEILKYCKYHCLDVTYAEDLTQETFLNFFENLSDYHYKGKTKNYLYTIASNLCKNFYKKKKDVLIEDEDLEKSSFPALEMTEQILQKTMMEAAIASLSEELQEVIILYYFQELKLSEIAKVLQISLSLVKYRLTRAKKKLEDYLRKEEFYEP